MSRAGRTNKRACKDVNASSEHLRDLLRKKLGELNQNTLGKAGEVSEGQLASIERLSRAVRLNDELKAPPSRWSPVIAVMAALLVMSLLMLIHVRETEISLEAAVTDINFTLRAEKPILGHSAISQLGISGLENFKISPETIAEFSGNQGNIRTMRLAATTNSISSGVINMATLIPPRSTKVWFACAGAPRTYRLSLKPPRRGTNVTLNLEAQGEVEIAAPDVLPGTRKFDFGKSGATIAFGSSDGILDVDLVLKESSDLQFYSQVPVEGLDLFRVEEFSIPGKSLVNSISTILNGALYLDSLNGEKRELRSGEQLRFSTSIGRMESLKLEDGKIMFKFHGRVSGMKIGEEGVSRNLMPNLLEWLKARQPLSLLWGGTIFLYGIIISALHWFRKPV